MQRLLLWLLLLGVVVFGVWRYVTKPSVEDTGSEPQRGAPEDEPLLGRWPRSQFFIEHDRFLAATDPQVVPAEKATWVRPDDEIFGVVILGKARAYPIPMIAYHHVVNDVIEGIPVAVTY